MDETPKRGYSARELRGHWYVFDNYYQWFCTSKGEFNNKKAAQDRADQLNKEEKHGR
jgi:hypothetical protein